MEKDPRSRLSLESVASHPWMCRSRSRDLPSIHSNLPRSKELAARSSKDIGARSNKESGARSSKELGARSKEIPRSLTSSV